MNNLSSAWVMGLFWFLHACLETWLGRKAKLGQLPFGSVGGAVSFALFHKKQGEKMETVPQFVLPLGSDTKIDLSMEGANPVLLLEYQLPELDVKVSIELKSVEALEHIRKIAPDNKMLSSIIDLAEAALKKI